MRGEFSLFNIEYDSQKKIWQGPETALEVNMMLKAKGKEDEFPLFTAVHRVFLGEIKPEAVIDALRNHPVHRE